MKSKLNIDDQMFATIVGDLGIYLEAIAEMKIAIRNLTAILDASNGREIPSLRQKKALIEENLNKYSLQVNEIYQLINEYVYEMDISLRLSAKSELKSLLTIKSEIDHILLASSSNRVTAMAVPEKLRVLNDYEYNANQKNIDEIQQIIRKTRRTLLSYYDELENVLVKELTSCEKKEAAFIKRTELLKECMDEEK